MRVVYERCCGVDVHKKTVVACVMTPTAHVVRTFGTMTGDILTLVDWLKSEHVRVVAMESTGVYWKPIYNLLEPEGFEILVVNAQHMKAVPGRKTDVKDAEWIADLLRHGLLRASFIPDRPQRELAEMVRYRRSLIEERAREANRIQKVLEGANIKLGSVVSNVLGVSGRAMLDALVTGVTDAGTLASHATTHLRATPEQLEAALTGMVGEHQRALLRLQLQHIDHLTTQIAELDTMVEAWLRPVAEHVRHLDSIPGVGIRTAQEVIAAIGTDMSRFPTHRHLASWAKLCPGTKESAGKRMPAGIGKGNPSLRVALVEAANAAARTKGTYLAALYHRIAARRGRKRAIVAVAHAILVIVYHLLARNEEYNDLGPTYFDQRDRDAIVRRQVKRLETLGYKVSVEDAA